MTTAALPFAGRFRFDVFALRVTVELVGVAVTGQFRFDMFALRITVADADADAVRPAELMCACRLARATRKAKSLSFGDGLCIVVAEAIPRLPG